MRASIPLIPSNLSLSLSLFLFIHKRIPASITHISIITHSHQVYVYVICLGCMRQICTLHTNTCKMWVWRVYMCGDNRRHYDADSKIILCINTYPCMYDRIDEKKNPVSRERFLGANELWLCEMMLVTCVLCIYFRYYSPFWTDLFSGNKPKHPCKDASLHHRRNEKCSGSSTVWSFKWNGGKWLNWIELMLWK